MRRTKDAAPTAIPASSPFLRPLSLPGISEFRDEGSVGDDEEEELDEEDAKVTKTVGVLLDDGEPDGCDVSVAATHPSQTVPTGQHEPF
jgi:hypothetical protein